MDPTPERPSRSAANIASTRWPRGLTTPIPVMTMRFLMLSSTQSLVPFSAYQRRTLPHGRQADFQHVRTTKRPRRTGNYVNRAGWVGFFVVDRGRYQAVAEPEKTSRQLRRSTPGAEVAD